MKKKPLKIDDKLETSLLSMFQSNDTKNSEKLPLVIKVNKFLISDFGGENDLHRVIEVNLDFYTVENGMYYHEFIAGLYLNSSANYPFQRIDMLITNAIERCYIEFLHRMNNHWGYHRETAKNEIQDNSLEHELFINSKNDFNKDAVYYSFNDFRDGFADTLSPFALKPFGGEYGLGISKFKSQITDIGSANVNEIWGVRYNSKLYIQVAGYFIPVVVTPDGYIINSMTTFNKHNYARSGFKSGFYIVFFPTAVLGLISIGPVGIFFPSALLGLAGGGIGAGIGAVSPKIEISDNKYKIDMATGMPVPHLNYQQNQLKQHKNIIIYAKSTRGKKLELYINGKKVCNFKPNSYFSMATSEETSMVEICLKSDFDKSCQNIAIEANNKAYFEAVLLENGKVEIHKIKNRKFKSTIDYSIENWILENVDAINE